MKKVIISLLLVSIGVFVGIKVSPSFKEGITKLFLQSRTFESIEITSEVDGGLITISVNRCKKCEKTYFIQFNEGVAEVQFSNAKKDTGWYGYVGLFNGIKCYLAVNGRSLDDLLQNGIHSDKRLNTMGITVYPPNQYEWYKCYVLSE